MLDHLTIHEPNTVGEASALLTRFGSEAAVYAGGTELLVVMKERLTHYPHLINIKTIPGLDQVRIEGDRLRIGALATHKSIEQSPLVREYIPLLAEVESNVANIRVRSTGTIGGNLCFAEPHSDPATLLIALNAEVDLASANGMRTLPLAEFFTGLLETVRREDEILTSIAVPLPVVGCLAYERFKIHERPTASVAVAFDLVGGVAVSPRIVVGCVGDRPLRVTEAESLLTGQTPIDVAEQAGEIVHAAIEPTEDAFESVEYKRHLARVLAIRAIKSAALQSQEVRRG